MRLKRRLAIAAMVLAGSVIGIGSASADWRDQVPVFRIGILGGELQDLQLRDHACLKARTERAMKVPVELLASKDYTDMNQWLRDGRVDVAELGAAGYAGLFLEDPDLIEPLVTIKQEDGTVGYHSVMFVRADSPYRTLDDLRNRSLVFTERLSTSGFLIPYYELTQQGYEPRRFFGNFAFAGSHPQAVTAVLNGDFEAGVTWSSVIGDSAKGYSRGNLRRMVDRGLLDMNDLRIVWQSELIPEGPYVARQAVPQEAKDLFRDVMLDLADGDGACFRRIVGGDAIDFEPITHDYYENIIAIARARGVGDS
jgi:phosphonate transport system substrate-binding protein